MKINKLKYLRAQNDLSQHKAAVYSGVNARIISECENGIPLPLNSKIKMANYLGVQPTYLDDAHLDMDLP